MTAEFEAPRAQPAPKRDLLGEFRKGWPIVLGASFSVGSGAAILPTYSLSILSSPMGAEMGWSRAEIGMAASFLAGGFALFSPLLGRMVDRYSIRLVAVPSMILYALALAGIALADGGVWQLYLAYAAIAVLGGGTTVVCYSRPVARAFHAQRGLALGLTMAGASVVAVVLPFVLGAVSLHYGWRAAWALLSIWAVLPLPVVLLVFKAGLAPAPGEEPRPDVAMAPPRRGAAYARLPKFWLLALATGLMAIPMGGILPHLVPMLTDSGLSRESALHGASILSFGSLCGRLFIGPLLDRLHPPVVAATVLALSAVGCVILAADPVQSTAFLALFLIGLSIGAEGEMIGFFTAYYFGIKAYSEILGWLFSCLSIGLVLGPLVAGAMLATLGSVTIMLYQFAVFFAAAAAIQRLLGATSLPVESRSS